MFAKTLSYTLCVAALSLLSCLQSRAHSIEVATGIFCDTQKQMERLVELLDGDVTNAVKAVNAEENDATACMFGTIAFIRGPEIATARGKSGAYQIVKVVVVGFLTETGLRAAVPMRSFSVERTVAPIH